MYISTYACMRSCAKRQMEEDGSKECTTGNSSVRPSICQRVGRARYFPLLDFYTTLCFIILHSAFCFCFISQYSIFTCNHICVPYV